MQNLTADKSTAQFHQNILLLSTGVKLLNLRDREHSSQRCDTCTPTQLLITSSLLPQLSPHLQSGLLDSDFFNGLVRSMPGGVDAGERCAKY